MKSIDEMRISYNEFIERQRKGYEITAAMIGYIVQKMQEASIVKGEVSISGRIKSFKSAYENTGKKAVDDCFGIRIVGNINDLIAIERELSRMLVLDLKKDHRKNKNTKYNGLHEMVHMDSRYIKEYGMQENESEPIVFPQIEVQYWSEETRHECVYGELAYAKYKRKDLLAIIARLENDRENAYKDLPICYEIQGNNIRRLSNRETLYKVYPEIQELEEKREKASVVPDADDGDR